MALYDVHLTIFHLMYNSKSNYHIYISNIKLLSIYHIGRLLIIFTTNDIAPFNRDHVGIERGKYNDIFFLIF